MPGVVVPALFPSGFGVPSGAGLNAAATAGNLTTQGNMTAGVDTLVEAPFSLYTTVSGGGTATVTAAQAGKMLQIVNLGANALTLSAANGSDTFNGAGLVRVGSGTSLTLACVQTGEWVCSTKFVTVLNAYGYFGNFYDTTTQSVADTTTAYVVGINTTDIANGVAIASGSRISIANPGYYNIFVSIQFTNTDTGGADSAFVWLRKNGANVANSNNAFTVPAKRASVNGALIGIASFLVLAAANDYFEIAWAASATGISISSLPATTSPVSPATPGVIVSVESL